MADDRESPEPMPIVCAWCLREQGLQHPERATDQTCARHVPDMREAWGLPRVPAPRLTPEVVAQCREILQALEQQSTNKRGPGWLARAWAWVLSFTGR